MKTPEKFVWLKKAGALVACSVFVGAAPAQSYTGGLPVAVSVPVGHLPTTGHSGPSSGSWSNSGGSKSSTWSAPQKPNQPTTSGSSTSSGSTSQQGNGHGHGQQFFTTLPTFGFGRGGRSLFGNNDSGWQGGPFGGSVQLDLTSTNANIVLGGTLFHGNQSVTVNLGGTNTTFYAGSKVTAAEYVAIRQVLSGGSQSLTLSSKGAATGGTFSISAISSAHISELVVPSGVTALDYATKGQTQEISGEVLNYGTIYGIVGSGMGNAISLNAQEIVNETGGLISTKAPSALLSAVGGVLSPVNLSLSAAGEIINAGSIVSSGSLTLSSSYGSIINGPATNAPPGTAPTPVPTIQAMHDVTLNSGSGSFANHGLVSSSQGNINFTANGNNSINISAAGGSFQAVNGNINVRESSYTGKGNINLTGGDYLSHNLNLYAGTGAIVGDVNQITGLLNTTAGSAHVTAATASLQLGQNIVGGDPTFVNSSGDITIAGDNQFSEDVAIIASGNIFAASDGQIVDNGHNVTLVAGANIVSSNQNDNGGTVHGNGGGGVTGSTGTPVTIDTSQGSVSGGNIDLTGSKVTTVIDTSSTTGSAGNVTLVAFASQPINGGLSSQGQVLLANSSIINASAGGSGRGGDVTIIAGTNSPNPTNVIQTGSVITSGGAAGGQGGNISIYTAAPTTSDAPTNTLITFGTNGSITTGNTFAPSSTINLNSNVSSWGDLVTAPSGQSGVAAGTAGASAGNITIAAGGSVITENLLAFGGGAAGGDSVNTNGGAGGNGGNINISSISPSSTITVIGQVNSSGGGGGGGGSNGTTFGTGGSGGSAGSISLVQSGIGTVGQMLLSTSGGVYAAQGGSGGNASATSVGGGGGAYGGGGGGGSSGTGGSAGNQGTQGTIGGGAGGAGYFGGGGGDLDGAGGGGGYTGGAAGGSALNATVGTLSSGGNGVIPGAGAPIGGVLGTAMQGGMGTSSAANGANIPTTSGGGNVTLSSTGFSSFAGLIVGSNVNVTLQGLFTIQSNIVGTSSVTINDIYGPILPASSAVSILTQSLTFNMGSIFNSSLSIGNSAEPITTNAQNITVNGTVFGTNISDSASSLKFDASGVNAASVININMTGNNAALDIAGLPATLASLSLNAGSDPVTGGTINFEQSSVQLAGGSITLTANNLSWSNAGSSALSLGANNSGGSGGTILITTNQLNGSSAFAIGSGNGELSLSATASQGGAGVTGGSISLIAPSASVTVDGTALNVGYSDASTAGNGGTIVLNVGSLVGAGGSTAILNASAAGAGNGGNGNGGSISITTNTANNIAIGTASGAIQLIATNGGSSSNTQTSGSVSVTNLGTGLLTVDPAGLLVSNTSGGATNVSGGSISLSANTVVGATGSLSLNADGIGAGNGGKITIIETNANAPAAVTLGPSGQFNLSAQGGTTGGNGGSITFSTQGALLLTTDAKGDVIGSGLSAAIEAQSGSGNGGNLTLTAQSFANANSKVGATKPLIFNASGQGAGNGGHIRINQLSPDTNLSIGKAAGDMEFIATNGATGLTAGSVIVIVSNNATNSGLGVLSIDPAGIKLLSSSTTNPNVNGGFIELNAPTIAAASTVALTSPLLLNANGAGSGKGGSITFEESNANSNAVIGNQAGQVQLTASGGRSGGSGGTILVSSGGNLTVNPAGLSVSASGNANGGFLALTALNLGGATDGSEGNLLVTGNLSVGPAGTGGGGSIALLSNSTNSFNIGSITNNLNGVEGTVSVTRGSLNISSAGTGGIVIQSAITTPQFINISTSAASGDLDINAQVGGSATSQIFIASTGGGTTNFGNIVGGATGELVTSATGNINLAATNTISGQAGSGQLKIVTTNLTANTTAGDIDIDDAISLSSTLTLQQLNAGGSFNITSGGSITTAGFTGGVNSNALVAGANSNALVAGVNSNALVAATNAANTSQSLGPGTTATAGDSGTVNAAASINGQFSAPQLNADSPRYKEVNKFIFQCVSATYSFGSVVNVTVTAPGSGSGGGATPNLRSNLAVAEAASAISGTTGVYTLGTDGVGGFSLTSDTSIALTGTFGNASATNIGIFTGAGASVTGNAVIAGQSVSFNTIGGNIGAAGGSAVQVNTQNLSLNTSGSGNVYINNIGTKLLTVSAITPATSMTISSVGGANYSSLSTVGGDLTLSSHGTSTVSNVTSSGNLNVTDTSGVLTLSSSQAAQNISANSTGGAIVSGLTATQGTIDIETANTSSVSTSQSYGAFTINETRGVLTASSVASTTAPVNITGATVNVSNLTNAGDVSVKGSATTLNTLTSTNGQISVTATGIANLTALTAATAINVADTNATTATGLTTTNGSISLKSSGAATLAAFVATNGSITVNDLNTTTVNGTGFSALTPGSGTISITSRGLATLSNLGAASGITLSSAGGLTATSVASDTGGITVTATGSGAVSLTSLSTGTSGDITIKSGGPTTLSGIDSAGSISVVASNATTVGSMTALGQAGDGFISVQNSTGLLQTAVNAQIYSQNDSILLENKNTSTGTIVINTGSDIETGAKPTPGGIGGNIDITIGTPPKPAQSPPQQGLAPSNTVVTATTVDGVIYWGTNGITALLANGAGNVVTAQGANVIFNTGKLPATAITLEGGTTIIADPPVMTGAMPASPVNAVTTAQSVAPTYIAASTTTIGAANAFTSPLLSASGSTQANALPPASSYQSIQPLAASAHEPGQTWLGTGNFSGNFGTQIGASGLNVTAVTQQSTSNGEPDARRGAQAANIADGVWISETELESGAIPAIISSEQTLDIHADVSSIVEMSETADYASAYTSGQTLADKAQNNAIASMASTKNTPPINSPLSGGVSFSGRSAVKEVSLTKGSVVFAPSTATVVQTPFGCINLAPKALVLVMAMTDGLAVYDLHDTHEGSVTVVAAGKEFVLAPGRHALVSSNAASGFENVNAAQLFAYRGINKQTITDSSKGKSVQVYTAEFNLPMAIGAVMPLKQLVCSTNPEAKKISQRLLKTTGIMADITTGGEQYQQVLRPKLVANNN